MPSTELCYGIPDIVLPRLEGGEINPAAFVGHALVVFFCSADPADALREIESFRRRSSAFANTGAWLIGILAGDLPESRAPRIGEPRIALARDSDGAGRKAFEALLDRDEGSGARPGGAFLFARGGSLDQAWTGFGHAEEVLQALRRRA